MSGMNAWIVSIGQFSIVHATSYTKKYKKMSVIHSCSKERLYILLIILVLSALLFHISLWVAVGDTSLVQGFEPNEEVRPALLKQNASFVLEHLLYWKYNHPRSIPSQPVFDLQWDQPRFLTFDYDPGGLNNIRLQFECIIVLAHMLNRTIVMPPRKRFYLIGEMMGLDDFYDFADLRSFVRIISSKEYLSQIGIHGENPLYTDHDALKEYLSTHSYSPKWKGYVNVLCVPNIKSCKVRSKSAYPSLEDFSNKRIVLEPENALLEKQTVHIRVDRKEDFRFFALWYSFFYFSNPEWVEYYVGMIRVGLHLNESFFKPAAEIIASIVHESGSFAALHVRRGDFGQFAQTQIDCETILSNTLPLLKSYPRIKSLFVATDEQNKTFFDPLRKHYFVYFLSDFDSILASHEIESIYHGALDQIICSAGELFIGTELSTFSAYITRIRYNVDQIVASNKEFYVTTRKYSGNLSEDSWESKSSFVRTENLPIWKHAPYYREFEFMLELRSSGL